MKNMYTIFRQTDRQTDRQNYNSVFFGLDFYIWQEYVPDG